MRALSHHDVDTDFGDNDDNFDYTDHSMRKGERGVAEDSLDEVSMDALKSYQKKSSQEISDLKQKQKNDPRGRISGQDADKLEKRKMGLSAAIHKIEKKGLQGVAEGDFNGEYDDEAGMAQSNLHTLARAVDGLLNTIDDGDNLPEWAQEKIAKAEMMLVSVWDYLQSQKEQGIDPDTNEGVAGPKNCWSGYRKVGTQPGTGKNAGKRVNDCEKIGEDEYMESLAQSLNAAINEKAVSKAQQRFMGMVHAAKQGEKPASKEVAKVAKGMSKKDAEDFAATKHKGLPEKKPKK
jgi:hypothetical protein